MAAQKTATKSTEKPVPAWRRAEAGSYRSSDDRFSIDSEGSGRWFVRDAEQPDDFGQPRTTGPFATLDDAKAAAQEQRSRNAEASPLAARLKEGDGGTRGGSRDRGAARRPGGRGTGAPAAEPEKKRATWLDRLEDRDRAAARRARALVRALAAAGISDAEEVVRRDVEGGRPAIAETALTAALRASVAAALAPDELVPAARRRVPGLKGDDEDLVDYAAFVASRVVEAILAQVSVGEGGERRDRELPGWELVEDAGGRRRLVVTAGDVLGRKR
jgi:hypothetical protein